jgi:hypothetical protein
MRNVLAALLALVLGFALASILVSRRLADRHAGDLAEQQEEWAAEKAELMSMLDRAREEAQFVAPVVVAAPVSTNTVPSRMLPSEIVARLIELSAGSSARTQPGQREIVYWLEELVALGPGALPAIQEFLQRYEDLELDTSVMGGGGTRSRLPGDFLFPPSLRFGLFDVVRRIGGVMAETVLAEALNQTGRGIEVAYLTRVLQELAPNRHRSAALAIARQLLDQPDPQSTSRLDRYHRDQLYAVLAFYNDTSYAAVAQTQLLGADGQVDRSALRYLQQSLGAQAVPLAVQNYHHPSLTNAAAKEPFARLALAFVGADAQANQLYTEAINDVALTPNDRRELIEDLNQDGFADPRNLTGADLPLIEKRITLIEEQAPGAMDEVNAAAFQEAYKDLLNMRAKITGAPPGQP